MPYYMVCNLMYFCISKQHRKVSEIIWKVKNIFVSVITSMQKYKKHENHQGRNKGANGGGGVLYSYIHVLLK